MRQTAEIIFECLFIKGDPGQPQKIIFEVIQIPGNGLVIEARTGITDAVIHAAAGFDLETRQHRDDFLVGFDYRDGNILSGAICR